MGYRGGVKKYLLRQTVYWLGLVSGVLIIISDWFNNGSRTLKNIGLVLAIIGILIAGYLNKISQKISLKPLIIVVVIIGIILLASWFLYSPLIYIPGIIYSLLWIPLVFSNIARETFKAMKGFIKTSISSYQQIEREVEAKKSGDPV